MKKFSIDGTIDRCCDTCPHYRENRCADEGHDIWCEANDSVDLDKHFEPYFLPFSRKKVPPFPEGCPLQDAVDAEDKPVPLEEMEEKTLRAYLHEAADHLDRAGLLGAISTFWTGERSSNYYGSEIHKAIMLERKLDS